MSRPDFDGRVAVVTGAASGLGLALSQELGSRGSRIVLADLDRNGVESAAQSIRDDGGRAESVSLDVSDREALRNLIEGAARRHGQLDLMFNNAGFGTAGELRDHTLEELESVLDVDLRAVVQGTHLAFQIMARQGGGHIVNTASVAGLAPLPGSAAYGAAKHGVVGLSRAARIEGADLGVRVSVVCPGLVSTRIFEHAQLVNLRELPPIPPLPFLSSERTARAVLRGVARNQGTIVTPAWWWLLVWLDRLAPGPMHYLAKKNFEGTRALRVEKS